MKEELILSGYWRTNLTGRNDDTEKSLGSSPAGWHPSRCQEIYPAVHPGVRKRGKNGKARPPGEELQKKRLATNNAHNAGRFF